MSEPALRLRGVDMRFVGVHALHQFELEVMPGEIVALIGPNGAGKTTALSIAATLLRPTRGEVSVLGRPAFADVQLTRDQVGFMPELFGVYDDMMADEYLRFFADAYGLDPQVAEERIGRGLDEVALRGLSRRPIGALSKGMKQKLFFVKTLLHDPGLLLLDEPFSGLDPLSSRQLTCRIQSEAGRGKAIVVTSHNLVLLQELATRVVGIRDGRIDGALPLPRVAGGTIDYDLDPGAARAEAVALLASRFAVTARAEDLLLRVELPSALDPAVVLRALIEGDVAVRAFAPHRASLAEHVEKELRRG